MNRRTFVKIGSATMLSFGAGIRSTSAWALPEGAPSSYSSCVTGSPCQSASVMGISGVESGGQWCYGMCSQNSGVEKNNYIKCDPGPTWCMQQHNV